ELVALDGYDHHDWHTFVIVVHGASSPVKLYCDGRFLTQLRQPITAAQRELVRRTQSSLHGSIQAMVPETACGPDYIFMESPVPGQKIDIDRVALSQGALSTG